MIEFKWDAEENRPKLIEVNARFWGSLNLAIRAGVDFPFLLYRLALGERVEGPAEYRIGLKSRWELGDLDHLLIRLKRDPDHPSLSGTRVRKRDAVAAFLTDFFRPSVVHEVFELWRPRTVPVRSEGICQESREPCLSLPRLRNGRSVG